MLFFKQTHDAIWLSQVLFGNDDKALYQTAQALHADGALIESQRISQEILVPLG